MVDDPGPQRAKSGGRVTPKAGRVTPPSSGRYTPPVPQKIKVSPPWIPFLMGALLAMGALVIVLNYMTVLPSGAQNGYLLIGLGLITAGFITATQWR